MKKFLVLLVAVLCFGVITVARDDDDVTTLRATARGGNEVPPINSDGTARFTATIPDNGTITFTLKFENLSTNLTLSHIHFGQRNVAGGVMIFLCGGGGQPACPAATSGTITGTITAANVTGPTGQGVNAGDLASALRIVRAGEGYVNLHSTKFPGGEIRGQVIVHRGDEDRDDR
jgi:hypothetical protein